MMNRRSLPVVWSFSKRQLSYIVSPLTRTGKFGKVFAPTCAIQPWKQYPTLQPWQPFDKIASEIVGSRFSDELTDELLTKYFKSLSLHGPVQVKTKTSFGLEMDLLGSLCSIIMPNILLCLNKLHFQRQD